MLSMCGPQIPTISIPSELAGNAVSRTPAQKYCLRTASQLRVMYTSSIFKTRCFKTPESGFCKGHGEGTPSPFRVSGIFFSYKIRGKTYTSRGFSCNRKITKHLLCPVTVLSTGDTAGSTADVVPAVKGLKSHTRWAMTK